MNLSDPEFIDVRVNKPGREARIFRASTFEDAFDCLDLWGSRWRVVFDGGDRLIVEELTHCGWRPDRWSAVFHVDGVLHVPAAVVISLYQRRVVARKPVMAWEAEGFRCRPVSASKWSLRGVFGAPRIGCERRANIAMRGDEELADYGLKPRPSRRLVRGYRFERPEAKDVNWKRFRKTRWRERG